LVQAAMAALSMSKCELEAKVDVAVDSALKEFRVSLVTQLQAVLEEELFARTASLDERERKLEARSLEVIEQALALALEPAAGPGPFIPRTSTALLKKPRVQVSAPKIGLATQPSLIKSGQALQHRSNTGASTTPTPAGGGTGLAPQVMVTYKLPLEPVAVKSCSLPLEPIAGKSCSLPPGGGVSSSLVSSLATSVRYERNAAVTGSSFHVPSPVASANGAQTHRVERILRVPYQLPLAAPLTYQQRVSYPTTPAGSPVATPDTPRRNPCQTPLLATRKKELGTANRRTSSAPASVMRLSEWNFLVPRGSVGPKRAEFDGGKMFRALDSNRDGSISPEEVEEYIAGQRHNSMAKAALPSTYSPQQPASPAIPFYDFRFHQANRSYTLSPVPSKANGRSPNGGGLQGSGGRVRSRPSDRIRRADGDQEEPTAPTS